MSRNTDPKCKQCRREGVKLYLKGDRCYSEKCAINRKPLPPGKSGYYNARLSGYGIRLRQKQKVKKVYGLTETQMKNVYDKASKMGGDKGLKLLQLLEMRLDNVVHLLGLAPSRNMARQMVNHGKFLVNGRKLDVPSYVTKVGDKISVKNEKVLLQGSASLKTPAWLKKSSKGGEVMAEPSRDMIDEGIKENLIIEFYSR